MKRRVLGPRLREWSAWGQFCNFYLKSKRSVAKATTEGPAAWVIANDGRRPALAAQLTRLFERQLANQSCPFFFMWTPAGHQSEIYRVKRGFSDC